MKLDLSLQVALGRGDPLRAGLPSRADIRRWLQTALAGQREAAEVTVRIVGAEEGAELNATYRGKAGPTNVLSFPFENPPGLTLPLLGDLVVCAPVVAREAAEQGKGLAAHWAHLVVHGALHLLGHDHVAADEADRMEALEIELMARLGFSNPYVDTETV